MQQDDTQSTQLEIVISDSDMPTTESNEWKMRYLLPHDFDAVCKICWESFPLDYSSSWFKEVCSGKLISFGLFHSGTLTGLLVAEFKLLANCDLEDQGIGRKNSDSVVYIMSLAVCKEYRRKGIATLLLNHLKTIVNVRSPTPGIIFLHVLSTNCGAISFYKRNGFVHHTTIMNYYMIQNVYYEGLTLVLYMDNGKQPCSIKEFFSVIGAIVTTPFRYLLKIF